MPMHISEGVLSGPVLAGGAALTAAGTAVGLKSLDYDQLPKVALMSAVFFVGSLIHLPVGPSNVHLFLGGLVGLILGWASFPAILVALALQAILFQYGGLVVLGVNTFNMALPAVLSYYLLGPLVNREGKAGALTGGALAGGGAVAMAAFLTGMSLWLSGEAFLQAGQAIMLANLPLVGAEAVFTAMAVGFLKQVKPAMLRADTAVSHG